MQRQLLVSILLLAGFSHGSPESSERRIGVGLVGKGGYCSGCVTVVEREIASMTSGQTQWLLSSAFRSSALVKQVREVLPPDEIYLLVVSDRAVELLVRMPVAPTTQMEAWRQLRPIIERIAAEDSGSQ